MSEFPDTIEEAYESDLDENSFFIGQIRAIVNGSGNAQDKVNSIVDRFERFDKVRDNE